MDAGTIIFVVLAVAMVAMHLVGHGGHGGHGSGHGTPRDDEPKSAAPPEVADSGTSEEASRKWSTSSR